MSYEEAETLVMVIHLMTGIAIAVCAALLVDILSETVRDLLRKRRNRDRDK